MDRTSHARRGLRGGGGEAGQKNPKAWDVKLHKWNGGLEYSLANLIQEKFPKGSAPTASLVSLQLGILIDRKKINRAYYFDRPVSVSHLEGTSHENNLLVIVTRNVIQNLHTSSCDTQVEEIGLN